MQGSLFCHCAAWKLGYLGAICVFIFRSLHGLIRSFHELPTILRIVHILLVDIRPFVILSKPLFGLRVPWNYNSPGRYVSHGNIQI